MKNTIIILLFAGCLLSASARQNEGFPVAGAPDTISLGYGIGVDRDRSAWTQAGVGREVLDNAPQIDAAKALYGRIAGLNVYQGVGTTADNIASLSIHGQAPLVLVDGFPRDLKNLTVQEIESVVVLKDAAAVALYGVRGANGVVMVSTRRGTPGKLKVGVGYQYGVSTQFRAPEFADAFTYARSLNEALTNDGLSLRYNAHELNAFRSGKYPSYYPNVDWWNEVYNTTASNHRLNLTFDGGSRKFRYYTAVDYMHDRGFFRSNENESRYKTDPTDVRLNIRANIDVDITRSTRMRLNVMGKIAETNRANYGDIYNILYNTPSAAFPIRYDDDGLYGGTSIYGANNPVALLMDSGNYRQTIGMLLGDLSLRQNLDALTPGLSAEVSVAFDNVGSMFDQATKTYRYKDAQASVSTDGTLITHPAVYGKDSEVVGHSQSFYSLYMRSDLQAKIGYDRCWSRHHVQAALIYDQQAYTANGRNNSVRRQSALATVGYTFDNRYTVNIVGNYSGSAYLPEGDAFHFYPAVNAAWVLSEEPFLRNAKQLDLLKLSASYGISGWDGNLSHELWRQSFGNTNAHGYYFSNNVAAYSGLAEGNLAAEGLVPEESRRVTVGLDLRSFGNRFTASVEGFFERRSHILISSGATVSGIIGIGVGLQPAGEHEYRGFDASIAWNDRRKDFSYGVYANASYLDSEVIADGQEYQPYDYLYHRGNRVGQSYGLEVVGIFQSQMEINESPVQTFSTVRPGDFKYRDQNGDNRIDDLDMVRMHGSSVPRFYFGFGFHVGYKGIELSADFQGMTGRTVNLLNCPLYKPLIGNGNISQTLLDHEIPWSAERASEATMPRLTTLSNANNYRNNSYWYRDGSFIKLRNLTVAYTLPKRILRFADMKIYLQGTNLFSLDNLKIVDPEQLGASYPSVRSYWAGVKFNF